MASICGWRATSAGPKDRTRFAGAGPGGPKGSVQIGYTATLQLLDLYHRTGKGWEIDDSKVDSFLNVIRKIPRPVVVYLAADHFDSLGPIVEDLRKTPENLMQLRDGKPLQLDYFGYSILPYTLATNPVLGFVISSTAR